MKKRFVRPISIDQALIMGLKMHDRGHCGLLKALRTGFELRYQYNFLYELGIDRNYFEKLLNEVQSEPVTAEWK